MGQQKQQQQQNDYTEDLTVFAHIYCILSIQQVDQFLLSMALSRGKVSNAG